MHRFHAHKHMYRHHRRNTPNIDTHTLRYACVYFYSSIYACFLSTSWSMSIALWTYMYLYVYFFLFLNKLGFVGTCMHTYKHIYIHIHICRHSCMCVCVCSHIHTYYNLYMYVCRFVCTYAFCVCTCIHIYVDVYAFMHVYMYTYISVYRNWCMYRGHWHVTQYFSGHALCPVETLYPLNISTYNITHEILKCAFRCIRV